MCAYLLGMRLNVWIYNSNIKQPDMKLSCASWCRVLKTKLKKYQTIWHILSLIQPCPLWTSYFHWQTILWEIKFNVMVNNVHDFSLSPSSPKPLIFTTLPTCVCFASERVGKATRAIISDAKTWYINNLQPSGIEVRSNLSELQPREV